MLPRTGATNDPGMRTKMGAEPRTGLCIRALVDPPSNGLEEGATSEPPTGRTTDADKDGAMEGAAKEPDIGPSGFSAIGSGLEGRLTSLSEAVMGAVTIRGMTGITGVPTGSAGGRTLNDGIR